MLKTTFIASSLLAVSLAANAELQALDDSNLAEFAGQGGVYLSGEFTINSGDNELPLWNDGTRPYYRNDNGVLVLDNSQNPDGSGQADQCDLGVCGMRFAIKLNENSEGWYVIDDLSGGMSFEGLTLRTERLTSAVNYDAWDNAAGDFQTMAIDEEVVQIGLPGVVSFRDFKFKFAVANNGEFGVAPRDENGQVAINPETNAPYDSFRQTDIFGVQLNGDIILQGNLLLFPVE
ncbi:MAG: DUF6160 family protein [Thalassolituus sp.]